MHTITPRHHYNRHYYYMVYALRSTTFLVSLAVRCLCFSMDFATIFRIYFRSHRDSSCKWSFELPFRVWSNRIEWVLDRKLFTVAEHSGRNNERFLIDVNYSNYNCSGIASIYPIFCGNLTEFEYNNWSGWENGIWKVDRASHMPIGNIIIIIAVSKWKWRSLIWHKYVPILRISFIYFTIQFEFMYGHCVVNNYRCCAQLSQLFHLQINTY